MTLVNTYIILPHIILIHKNKKNDIKKFIKNYYIFLLIKVAMPAPGWIQRSYITK